MEEEVEGDGEHFPGLRVALGPASEAGEVVADRTVGAFDQVGFGLGLGVRDGDAMALEREAIAGVGIGEDGRDVGNSAPGLLVKRYGAGDAVVADMMRNNATLSPAISSPYDRPASFFWTKV